MPPKIDRVWDNPPAPRVGRDPFELHLNLEDVTPHQRFDKAWRRFEDAQGNYAAAHQERVLVSERVQAELPPEPAELHDFLMAVSGGVRAGDLSEDGLIELLRSSAWSADHRALLMSQLREYHRDLRRIELANDWPTISAKVHVASDEVLDAHEFLISTPARRLEDVIRKLEAMMALSDVPDLMYAIITDLRVIDRQAVF